MAWFTYACKEHGEFRQSLSKREKSRQCPVCGVESYPVLKAGSSISVVERLDNGVMARRVERLHNIEEIMSERADKFADKPEGSDGSETD